MSRTIPKSGQYRKVWAVGSPYYIYSIFNALYVDIFYSLIIQQSIDAILRSFVYFEERTSVMDYTYLRPKGKLVSMLSSPKIMTDIDLSTIFNVFRYEVWIMIIFPFLALTILNMIEYRGVSYRFSIVLDYFGLIFGKSNNLDTNGIT